MELWTFIPTFGSLSHRVRHATGLTLEDFMIAMRSKPVQRWVVAVSHTRCNLRCAHCFMGEPHHEAKRVALSDVSGLLEWACNHGYKSFLYPKEPLLFQPFFDLIRRFPQSFIETNAVLLARKAASIKQLKKHGITTVMSSLHGLEHEHCLLTNAGTSTYRDTLKAFRTIKDHGMGLVVNTALYQRNLHCLPDVATLLAETGVDKWYISRVFPVGRASKWPMSEFIYGDEAGRIVEAYVRLAEEFADRLTISLDVPFGPNYYSVSTLRYLAGQGDDTAYGTYWCPTTTSGFLSVSTETQRIFPCFYLHDFEELLLGTVEKARPTLVGHNPFGAHELHTQLRGKCASGSCHYHDICLGGCRAVAYSFAKKMGVPHANKAEMDFCVSRYLDNNLHLLTKLDKALQVKRASQLAGSVSLPSMPR